MLNVFARPAPVLFVDFAWPSVDSKALGCAVRFQSRPDWSSKPFLALLAREWASDSGSRRRALRAPEWHVFKLPFYDSQTGLGGSYKIQHRAPAATPASSRQPGRWSHSSFPI